MNTPHGDLEIAREYTCGCKTYRDRRGAEFDENGLFCDPSAHRQKLVVGEEKQLGLELVRK